MSVRRKPAEPAPTYTAVIKVPAGSCSACEVTRMLAEIGLNTACVRHTIYRSIPRGNLVGELPLGSWPDMDDCGTLARVDGGDPYECAKFRSAGRTIIVSRDR